ncbi:MAG: NAD-dependent epimerase/dehydratase family protein, partial [Kiritimatiellia bacterium]
MRILVAGTGFSGSRILRTLAGAGHEVWGMNRSGVLSGWTPERIFRGDVLDPDSLRTLRELPAMDLLISTLSGTGQQDPQAYRSVYVDGPGRIAEMLRWRDRSRIWMLGSTGVYGVKDGSWVDEQSPAQPLHRNGEVQLAAEEALGKSFDEISVLRLSGLYGPGRTRLIRQALRKRSFLKPEIWSNQIHVEDVAGLIGFLAGREMPPPSLLLVSDVRPALRREIFSWVREQTAWPEGCYDEDHPRRAGSDRGNKRVNSGRMQSLGYFLRYPTYREGLTPYLEAPYSP